MSYFFIIFGHFIVFASAETLFTGKKLKKSPCDKFVSLFFLSFFSRLSKIYERITSMCQKYASRKVVVHTCSFWSNLGKKFHISTLVTRRFDWKQSLNNNVQIQFIIGWKYANRLKKINSNILYRNQGDYKSFSIKNYTLISTSLMLLQSDDVGIVKSGLRKASGHLWNGGLGKLCSKKVQKSYSGWSKITSCSPYFQ